MPPQPEARHLESIAEHSLYLSGVNADRTRYTFQIFKRFFVGTSLLEMGPAEGVMTELLARLDDMELAVVEGAKTFCDDLRRRFPSVGITNSLFEDFMPARQFDNIVLGHVLEHVEDPVDILTRASRWLSPGGRILAAVPNSRSLHRQAAVIMNMLAFEEQLNDMDRHHGHRRVYNPETFRRDFLSAGLKIDMFGGYWIKPVSNKQIEDNWTPAMVDAFMALGERYPDIAAEIYVVASRPH